MPIHSLLPVNLKQRNNVEEEIGARLCLASIDHFTNVLGQSGIGLSYESCNAAVAVVPNFTYPTVFTVAGAAVAAVYGSSRLHSGLDDAFNTIHNYISPTRPFSTSNREEHAEQTAIRIVESQQCTLWAHGDHAHIYIDFEPSSKCEPWLEARPENWFVHYKNALDDQERLIKLKKDIRKDEFGRITERKVNF